MKRYEVGSPAAFFIESVMIDQDKMFSFEPKKVELMGGYSAYVFLDYEDEDCICVQLVEPAMRDEDD